MFVPIKIKQKHITMNNTKNLDLLFKLISEMQNENNVREISSNVEEPAINILAEKMDKLLELNEKIYKTLLNTSKPILSLPEASDYINLSKSDLYKKTSMKIIKHYKPNNKVIYFRKSDLEDYILSHPVV